MKVGHPVNREFWAAVEKMFPNDSHALAVARLLSSNDLRYTTPNKGAYSIEVDKAKCRALMFYPKSGRLVIQLNGANRAHTFESDDPRVLMEKAKSFALPTPALGSDRVTAFRAAVADEITSPRVCLK